MKKEIEKLDTGLTAFVENLDIHFTKSKAKSDDVTLAASELYKIKESFEIIAKIAMKYRTPKEDLYYIQKRKH